MTVNTKLVFASVGSRFPMDRLLIWLNNVLEKQPFIHAFAQIGNSEFSSPSMRTSKQLNTSEFENKVANCDVFISHAGMGNILLAAEYKKPIIIIPRQTAYKEHINDHQLDTARAFSQRPFIWQANTENELEKAILSALKTSVSSDQDNSANFSSKNNLIRHIQKLIEHEQSN